MDAKKVTEDIVRWLSQKVSQAGARGFLIGLSGGLDSSVASILCKKSRPETTLGLILPCHSIPEDEEDARMLANKFMIEIEKRDLSSLFDNFIKEISLGNTISKLTLANLKSRLRAVTLYYFANQMNYLVVGSTNRTELSIGYFTKYGDSSVDLMPLGGLVKSEVRELARFLQVPDRIISKPPSAGLWAGQTDEEEIGMTYSQLDTYILKGKGSPEVKEFIDETYRKTEHKRITAPVYKDISE